MADLDDLTISNCLFVGILSLALALLAFDFDLLLLEWAADLVLVFDLLAVALLALLLCVAALCDLAFDLLLLLWWRAA